MTTFDTVTIVGTGLIGGSIGLGIKQKKIAKQVIGVARSEASVARAIGCGVVDSATTDLEEAAQKSCLMIVCTPVSSVVQTVLASARACGPDCLITDAGSTKRRLVADIEQAIPNDGPWFVGSHPLAGDHRTGPESARADLLEGRSVVVTPTENSNAQAVAKISQFWTTLGAKVITMSPAKHDTAVARTSHAPHVIATALASATPAELLDLAGGGWRDTTRVAAGSATLWRDILLDNREETVAALEAFGAALGELKQAIASGNGDAIQQYLKEGKLRRDALGS